jgi:uridine kinase
MSFVLGICGGSGSGKTTLLKRLQQEFAVLNPSVFTMDNYYKKIDLQERDKNGEVNFDLPTALNEDKLNSDLLQLVGGEAIEVKEYHFNAPADRQILNTIAPSPLIIVEGLFLFHYSTVYSALDYSVFVEVEPAVQLDRRLYRDQETRGYSRESILYQWENHVLPCYDNFIYPYQNKASFSFRNDQRADEDFLELVKVIKEKLSL